MLDASVVGTVVIATFLFDLADIRPQVGSFGFVLTGLYFVYLLLRVFLSLLAAIMIGAAQPNLSPFVLGFLAALGGVVVLQNFAIKVAGQDVLNLAGLVENYRIKMIAEEGPRAARALRDKILDLTRRLAAEVQDEAQLRREVRTVLLHAHSALNAPDAISRVNELLNEIDEQCGNDAEFRRQVYAAQIAQADADHAYKVLLLLTAK